MKKVGIVGGGGYVAGELLRLLVFHNEVELDFVLSSSQAGQKISNIHKDLVGETDAYFTDTIRPVDVLFVTRGHGQSATFLGENAIDPSTLIIDLSRDHRFSEDGHDFIYGLPEWKRNEIKENNHIANPGCFATAMQLAILPLATNNLLNDDLHLTGITGSTGAGQKPVSTTHFSWRNNNISTYKAFNHQHLDEVKQLLEQTTGTFDNEINFIPMRGDYPRGIFVNFYTHSDMSESELQDLYKSHYEDEPFTIISDEDIHLKQVVNTNKCLLNVTKQGDNVFVQSIIDNMLKGAAGQAVQNMNIALGFDEREGLRLKSIAY